MNNSTSSVQTGKDGKERPPGDHWWPVGHLSGVLRPWDMLPLKKQRASARRSALRILKIGFSDVNGGAAIASSRLIDTLEQKNDIATLHLVGRQHGTEFRTVSLDRVHRFILWRQLRKALAAWNVVQADPYAWMPFESAYLRRTLETWEPHVIHLHNLHGGWGTIPPRSLEMLSAKAPVVWTLHDMWATTGHCAYSLGCERWRDGCGQCPDLSLYPAMWRDRTRQVVEGRRQIFGNARPILVTPSRWLRDVACNAHATRGLDVRVIPNGVDLSVFHPARRAAARERLDVANGRTLLMFAAETLDGDQRKGGRQLRTAIERVQQLRHGRPLDIILMGGSGESLLHGIAGLEIHGAGFVSDAAEAASLFAAADLFICPSLQDNLPNTLIEAAACGTAAAVFDAGGSAETVEHGVTGVVVQAGDATAMADAIVAIADDAAQLAKMGRAARLRAEKLYDANLMADEYLSLYRELVARSSANG